MNAFFSGLKQAGKAVVKGAKAGAKVAGQVAKKGFELAKAGASAIAKPIKDVVQSTIIKPVAEEGFLRGGLQAVSNIASGVQNVAQTAQDVAETIKSIAPTPELQAVADAALSKAKEIGQVAGEVKSGASEFKQKF